MKLKDKIAVITGGNSGIGLAGAQALAQQGAKVVIFGRSQEKIDQALQQIDGEAFGVAGDVAKPADLDKLFSAVKEKFGGIDILFVNAGVAQFRPLDASDEAFYDQMFDINVKGAYFTVQKAKPLFNKGASVILNASVAGQKGFATTSVYSATKAAVRSLARTLSAELLEQGVRVNAISPGPIETPIYGRMELPQEVKDGLEKQLVASTPLKRMGKPEEIAGPLVFLASPDSSYIVGVDLVVDGGMTQL